MTAFDLAQRYIGIRELGVKDDHPLIRWWLTLCGFPTTVKDEVPWCSAFVNGMSWELRLPRSKSAAARSWLNVGRPINISEAEPKYDVVVLKRGAGEQPGPDVIKAPGHVGFFAGREGKFIIVCGGNQGDGVSLASFEQSRLLGVRRLLE